MNNIIAVLKLTLFALLTFCVIPLQLIIMFFHKGKLAYILPYLWHNIVRRAFLIHLEVIGSPVNKRQTIYVSNHVSYLDIPLIGSVLKASFVAKKDVSSWPVFGFLSKLQQTAFISRERKDAQNVAGSLTHMLDEGKNLIIFPEGTSTEGVEVHPFKSSLFSIIVKNNDKDILIQPFTLHITHIEGKPPKTQKERDIYAWHLNMDDSLAAHLWRFLKHRGAKITLQFHAPIHANEYSDRKTLAKECHSTVSNGLKFLQEREE